MSEGSRTSEPAGVSFSRQEPTPSGALSVTNQRRHGFLYAIGAYGLWGLVPLYFALLSRDHVPPFEILAHRVVWSVLFLAPILYFAGRFGDLRKTLATWSLLRPLIVSSLLVASNWYFYILSVSIQKISHASLGYFITPLVSVMLGTLVLKERLRPLQMAAIAIAAIGVAYMILQENEIPWTGFVLAITFSLYGLIRKQVPVDGLIGLSVETAILVPIALAFLLTWHVQGMLSFGNTAPIRTDVLIALSGMVTAIPLLCFGQAARRLPLSQLSFFQYMSPTIQFVLAVLFLEEHFTQAKMVGFPIIWVALAFFTFDMIQASSSRRGSALTPTPAPVADS